MGHLIDSYLRFAKGERSPLSPWVLLLPAGLIGKGYSRLRNGLFDHGLLPVEEAPLPVISVGNLTVGGTNKTPFVEMLARRLEEMGLLPGILSRGYGGRAGDPVIIRGGRGDRSLVGDEPLLLSGRLPHVPVVVFPDRVRSARLLARESVAVAVADDAFQHRRLDRDVDVVLVDACCPFGNGRIVPAGTLREGLEGLRRAHLVVITKYDQVSPEALAALVMQLSSLVGREQLFLSRLCLEGWSRWSGRWIDSVEAPQGRAFAFCAIGSPSSFRSFLLAQGLELAGERFFRDHHRFGAEELTALEAEALRLGADYLVCTEKDVYNVPSDWQPQVPLHVPRVASVVDDEPRFWRSLVEALKPRFVVVTNGHGEDAIGAELAGKLRRSFPASEVYAFPLVGRGVPYERKAVPVVPPPSVTPSGGVVKYSLRVLWQDLRAGLLPQILAQLRSWRTLRSRCRTPLCLGDVYLFLHTLWGQGRKPLLVATAKTALLSGHFRLESWLLRRRCRAVWTRDEATARQLRSRGLEARFAGNPIMDLLGDNDRDGLLLPPSSERILVLPGSRDRAYDDIGLILETVLLLHRRGRDDFLLVPAPTLELSRLLGAAPQWRLAGTDRLLHDGGARIHLFQGPVAVAARQSRLVLGLGGTANQVCAGLGLPVVSVREKGKEVQQKLLGEAERLVPPQPEALADAIDEILGDGELFRRMSEAGKRRLGGPGALDDLISFAGGTLGWEARHVLYVKLSGKLRGGEPM
ncbi:MAG: tetraacyldisaccharide 4'-kinase [Synergistales bacterium]|nr:tetraacyldisaccharide 4'-kinase [Synergistales bacterium]